jgi:galactofuranosylgalactofuranosylrhamnosyl-N-acetylglucosaminyl-diphospho-decaprenol beta-1,5/1,6-galactofuranosyltransferase
MDDDIDFDADVLVTTHAFAARATRPTVVGGAMVDLFRPNTMYEAGAVIDAGNVLRAVLHDRRLDRPGALDDLARELPCHFNGWWYCAIPAGMFREHGLPLPVFIRGDDMEYGARLASRGVPTVSLPPVAVWHEPFYAKPPGWQLYYDLRNRLIFAACHPSLVRLDPPGIVLRRLVDCLLKHDYMQTELVIRAIEDFLAGPQALDAPMDALHREVSALAAAHAPERPASAVGMPPAPWRPPPRNGAWRRLSLLGGMVALASGLVRPKLRPDLLFVDQWHPWATMRVGQYGLSDRMRSYVQVYRYDRDRMRRGLRRGLAAAWRYRRERRDAAGRWRAAHPELSSWGRWESVLGLAPATNAPAAGPEGTTGERAPDRERAA